LSIRILIQIQGFDDQNWKKFTAEIKLIFFGSKIVIYLSIKDVQATGEVFIPQKKRCSPSKLEFSSLLWVILALLDPDPYSQSGTSRPK
jgi:hypothetical protein